MSIENALRQEIKNLEADIERLRRDFERKENEAKDYWSQVLDLQRLLKEESKRAARLERKSMQTKRSGWGWW